MSETTTVRASRTTRDHLNKVSTEHGETVDATIQRGLDLLDREQCRRTGRLGGSPPSPSRQSSLPSLFLYVFGSAIVIPGVRYQDFLLPGLIGQSIVFGLIGSGTAVATDFASGVVDRFKSLPIGWRAPPGHEMSAMIQGRPGEDPSPMTIGSRTTVTALALALLVSGCADETTATKTSSSAETSATAASSAPADTSPATKVPVKSSGSPKPQGFTVVADKKLGYQIAVPSGYVRIKSKSDLNKIAEAGAKAFESKGLSQQLLNESLKMIAVSGVTGNSINVVAAGAGGTTVDQLPDLKPTLKQQAARMGGEKIVITDGILGGQPALRSAFTVNNKGKKTPTVQYYTIHDDQLFVLTFTELVKISAHTEKQTVQSWRFI